ncbi:hypothetical protein ACFX1Q_034550 [Malus domestica]
MEFVCDRVAESEKTMCISGNNSDGASQSAAGRGEDSSDESDKSNRFLFHLIIVVFHIICRFCISFQQECGKLQATAEILESEIAQIPCDIWRLSGQIEKLKEE